jgi:hypothetical protein
MTNNYQVNDKSVKSPLQLKPLFQHNNTAYINQHTL